MASVQNGNEMSVDRKRRNKNGVQLLYNDERLTHLDDR
jgi:hypothetical protein